MTLSPRKGVNTIRYFFVSVTFVAHWTRGAQSSPSARSWSPCCRTSSAPSVDERGERWEQRRELSHRGPAQSSGWA